MFRYHPSMKRTLPYNILLVATFLWCALLFLPPVAASIEASSSSISSTCYKFFSLICHQYDSRSLHVFGWKLAVCARCFGVYLGFLIGVLVVPFFYPRNFSKIILWLTVAVLPMMLDVLLDVVQIHVSNLITRMTTGAFFGIVAAAVLTPIFEEGCSELITQLQQYRGRHYESQTG